MSFTLHLSTVIGRSSSSISYCRQLMRYVGYSTRLTKPCHWLQPSNVAASYRFYTETVSGNVSSGTTNPVTAPRRVAIVGSGPAGFYTAQRLLRATDKEAKQGGGIYIDMIEAQPIPYGLARYGVAPDHPEVKSVIHKFEKIASESRFRYFGNVRVGTAISMNELQARYDAIVLAYGAELDKALPNVPGANDTEAGVLSARDFVGWYNGLPECQALDARLRQWLATTTSAVVVGAGNVALDVARILLMPRDKLACTDITASALEALQHSKIRHVHIVQRRGPLQVAFTSKELREMIQLPDTRLLLDLQYLQKTLNDAAPSLAKQRPRKRLMDLLLKGAEAGHSNSMATRHWYLHFLRSPSEFIIIESNATTDTHESNGKSTRRLSGIRLEHNQLVNEQAVPTNISEVLPCQLAFKSIGYRSTPIEGVPFDDRQCAVPNEHGRVLYTSSSSFDGSNIDSSNGKNDRFVPGLYVTGWLKRGPTGVIASTLWDAQETADCLLEDMAASSTLSSRSNSTARIPSDLPELLESKNIRYFTFDDWRLLDNHEMAQGKPLGKPREKFVRLEDMIKLLDTKLN